MSQADWTYHAIVGGCIALALFIRFRRFGRTQRLRRGTLWIIPAIFILFAVIVFVQFPPSGLGWLWVAMGLAAGSAIGWQRGRLVELGVDPATGHLSQRSARGALVFIGVLIVARWALRYAVMLGNAHWHLGPMLVSDIFIAFAAGVPSANRIEIYLRAGRLLRSR